MIRIITDHHFRNLMDAIDDAVEAGFTVKFVINERGFGDYNQMTYLPETVNFVEIIQIPSTNNQETVLYRLKMINGTCGWISNLDAFANTYLNKHLNRIKENFRQDEL